MLDMAQERDGQSTVRGIQRIGDGDPDIRLDTNHMGCKSADDPMVGTRECFCEFRRDPVDLGPDSLLHKRQRPHTPFLACISQPLI
jgi:hypothetical protein